MGGPFDWFHWTDIEIDHLVILGCSMDTADTIEVEGNDCVPFSKKSGYKNKILKSGWFSAALMSTLLGQLYMLLLLDRMHPQVSTSVRQLHLNGFSQLFPKV